MYNSHQNFNNREFSHAAAALSVDLLRSSLWVLSLDIGGDLSVSLHPLMPVLPAELFSGQTETDQQSRDQADVDGPIDDWGPVVRIEDQPEVLHFIPAATIWKDIFIFGTETFYLYVRVFLHQQSITKYLLI